MKTFVSAAAACVLLLGAGAPLALADAPTNSAKTTSSLSPQEQTFLQTYSQESDFENALSHTASEKSPVEMVRQFAQTDLHDRAQLHQQAEQLAQANGESLPAKLTSGQQEALSHLSALNGAAFDQDYLSQMRWVDQTDKNELANASLNANNPQIKQFILTAQRAELRHAHQAQELMNTPTG